MCRTTTHTPHTHTVTHLYWYVLLRSDRCGLAHLVCCTATASTGLIIAGHARQPRTLHHARRASVIGGSEEEWKKNGANCRASWVLFRGNRMRVASAAEGRQPRLRTQTRVSRGRGRGGPPPAPPPRGRTEFLSRGIRPNLQDVSTLPDKLAPFVYQFGKSSSDPPITHFGFPLGQKVARLQRRAVLQGRLMVMWRRLGMLTQERQWLPLSTDH